MRKLAACFSAGIALTLVACSSGAAPKPGAASGAKSGFDQESAAVVAQRELTGACGGRDAINIGSAFARSLEQSNASSYTDVATALRNAAAAAPEELRDDFRVVTEAEIPFLRLMASVRTNPAALAGSAEYQQAIAALSSPEFALSTQRISTWFAQHCSPPSPQ